MKKYKYLIIGGGMAADAAVKGIREIDEGGDMAVIGEESDPPCARPPLSKDLWKDGSMDDIWMRTADKGTEVITGRRVTDVEPDEHRVKDAEGACYGYEKLLLATGGRPKTLPFDGGDAIYYRTASDYRRLRERTGDGNLFAVIGAGFIGQEIAAALRMNEKDVTMIFPEAAIGARLFPAGLARALERYYEDRGVTIVSGRKPSGIERAKKQWRIQTENSRIIEADTIVAGLGIQPNIEQAKAAGLETDDGIRVDEFLRAGRDDIYAAGDVANFHCPALGRRIRVEHEDNALTMGEAAGRNMAGEEKPYTHLPFFYSDLFDAGYEAVGHINAACTTVGDVVDAEAEGIVFYLRDHRVCGVLFWNLFGKIDAGRELIAAPGPHTEDGLRAWARERMA